MQTTLLGFGIAIILALVAALVAPAVIDWGQYRATVEAQASRLTGLDVRINGAIEARLLPSPLITLRNVEIGNAASEPALRAAMLKVELGLGPLLRGQLEASEVHLIGPQISLGFDRTGALHWAAVTPAPRLQKLSIDKLIVEDGRLAFTDEASGSRLVLQKVRFNGDMRSLEGPFKGEGAFAVGDALFSYRIGATRVPGAGAIKIRLGIDPADQPLTVDADGTLSFERGIPQFAGTLALARPAGAALAGGRRVMSAPWHAAGRIRATPASISLQDAALQYGPEERAVNVNGSATLALGDHPHLEGVISALQVDVDRALAAPDVTYQPPLVVIRNFLQAFTTAMKPPIPVKVAVGIDALTIGGTSIEALRGDMQFDAAGWSFDRLEFKAPGSTRVSLSGRLGDTPGGFAFSGPGTVESDDVETLMAWLQDRSDTPAGQAKAFKGRGDVTIGSNRIAVEAMNAALNQDSVQGRLSYTWPTDGHAAGLDADLRAEKLNFDALAAMAKAAAGDKGFVLPGEAALALDVGTATIAGVDARTLKAQIKFSAGQLQIDRLSIGDLGGAKLEASGRIDELSSQPRGQVTVALDARVLDGLSDIVAKFAPGVGDAWRGAADRLAPARVHGVLTVDHAAPAGSTAKLHLDGSLAATRVVIDGQASGDPLKLGDAMVRLDSRLDADDATALLGLFGADRVVAVDQLPGRVTLSAAGPLGGDLHVGGQIAASGLKFSAQGVLRLSGEQPQGSLRLQASTADLQPLHKAMTGQSGSANTVTASATLGIAGGTLSFTDIDVGLAKSSVRGHLAVDLTNPIGIDGEIEADGIDAASALAIGLGLPSGAQPSGAPWSSEPIGGGAFAPLNGSVTFKLNQAALSSTLVVHAMQGKIRFRPTDISLEDIDGDLAGGRLAGNLLFHRDPQHLATHARLTLIGADAATLLGPPLNVVDGHVTLTLECDGLGANPVGLVGSLHGSTTLALADVHFAGFDVAAFNAAIRAADQGGSLDAAKLQPVVGAAMANGRLAVPQANAVLTLSSGQMNMTHVLLPAADGAALALDGAVDLARATVDVRMTLSGPTPANALIPTRPELAMNVKGPFGAPQRALDVSALASWLTLRAAELQTRRLEAVEATRHDDEVVPIVRPEAPAIRLLQPGTVVELSMPPSPSAVPGVERLQPPPAAAAGAGTGLNQTHSPQPVNADRTPPPATAAPPMSITPQPQPPTSGSGAAAEPQRSVFEFLFRPQN